MTRTGDEYSPLALCSEERMENLKDLCRRVGVSEPKKHLTEQEERQFRSALQKRMFYRFRKDRNGTRTGKE
jgi:hypothetical protein